MPQRDRGPAGATSDVTSAATRRALGSMASDEIGGQELQRGDSPAQRPQRPGHPHGHRGRGPPVAPPPPPPPAAPGAPPPQRAGGRVRPPRPPRAGRGGAGPAPQAN